MRNQSLSVTPGGMVVYRYSTSGGEATFKFNLLCEVGEPYQQWFKNEMTRLGWVTETRAIAEEPWVADFLVSVNFGAPL